MYLSLSMLAVLLFLIVVLNMSTNEALPSNRKSKNISIHSEVNLILPNVNSDKLTSCVTNILNKYYRKERVLTYVDMDFGCNSIINTIHSLTGFSVVSRKCTIKLQIPNEGYLLTVRSVSDFTRQFPDLTKEATWNPTKKFVIIFKLLNENDLKDVFDLLLKTHVTKVLIINGTYDVELYTYNPFENYACGKHYSRIISYGKCSSTKLNLFPQKLVTGLRNCTLNIAAPHWPPFSINPSERLDGMIHFGVEQYVMQVIAEIEHFNVNYTYIDAAEEFATISLDMAATWPMTMLQNNISDVMFGGLFLVPSRAEAFDYLYGHLDYSDDLRIIVKTAPLKPVWKYFYLEFNSIVWVILILLLILFSVILIILMRAEDRSYVVLKLFDSLLLHGYNLRSRFSVKCVFIFWVWFAYLVNCFYQSSLMSLTTKPSTFTQISESSELYQFDIKPCFSYVIMKIIEAETFSISDSHMPIDKHPRCEDLLKSIETVSKSNYLYTIVIYSIYRYNIHKFHDNWGNPLLYSFKRPVKKIINAIYLYKGFPLQRRMHMLTLRLRENGLVEKHLKHQYFLRKKKQRYESRGFQTRFVIPWYLYIFGCFMAFLTLVLEYSLKRRTVGVNTYE